ncbi:MAG: Crp/Fnr family transcriptional regulator [Chloroflexota bacterium]
MADSAAYNRILARLPKRELRLIDAQCSICSLKRGQWLAEAGSPLRHVYFPLTGVYSAFGASDHRQVGIGPIGNEGFVGLPALLDGGIGLFEVAVQVSGQALRLDMSSFQRLASSQPCFQARLQRYAQAFLSLSVQTAACNALHTSEQRCARWILMMHDRGAANQFPLSHEMLARLLGVRRPTVSLATAALKASGVVQFRRGSVQIMSRRALRAKACECYAVVEAEYRRLLGPESSPPGRPGPGERSAA